MVCLLYAVHSFTDEERSVHWAIYTTPTHALTSFINSTRKLPRRTLNRTPHGSSGANHAFTRWVHAATLGNLNKLVNGYMDGVRISCAAEQSIAIRAVTATSRQGLQMGAPIPPR